MDCQCQKLNKTGKISFSTKKKVLYIQYIQTWATQTRTVIQTHIYSWFSLGRLKGVWMLVAVGRLWSVFNLCKNSSLRESSDCRHNRGLNKFTLFFYYNFFFTAIPLRKQRTVTNSSTPKAEKKASQLQSAASSSSAAENDVDNRDNRCRIAHMKHIRNGGAAWCHQMWQFLSKNKQKNKLI